jgi:hypothetical protein
VPAARPLDFNRGRNLIAPLAEGLSPGRFASSKTIDVDGAPARSAGRTAKAAESDASGQPHHLRNREVKGLSGDDC